MKQEIRISDHFTYSRLLRFVMPAIAMMIFTSIYGVVDGFFVSNFVGKTPFAALNLVMPFIMILGGFGFVFGTGGSALVAKTLGEGKKELANRYFTMILIAATGTGVVLSVLGILFIRPIAVWMGASEEMLKDCVIYGRVTIFFTTSFILQNVFQSFLITAEKPHLGFLATLAAGATNMVLDGLFIAVFHWGLAGAALATGLGQVVGAVIPIGYFVKDRQARLRLVRTGLERRPILLTVTNGASEFVNNISMSLVGMLFNIQLMKFAGENGVAAYGVLMYVQFVFAAVFIGFAIGSAPIISFHYGAGNHSELKNMLKKSSVLMVISGMAMTVLAVVFAGSVAGIFVGYDPELLTMTEHAFRLFALAFVFMGMGIFSSSLFTALNNGLVSAVISFLRTLVFQVFCILALPLVLGIDGIWLSSVIAEALALAVSMGFLVANRKRYHYL